MFRKCLFGCVLTVAAVAAIFALAGPQAQAIPIGKVSMHAKRVSPVKSPGNTECRQGDVVTHVCTATLKAAPMPQIRRTGPVTVMNARPPLRAPGNVGPTPVLPKNDVMKSSIVIRR